MCHPKGRSAAKDARSALTRRPARSYSAPTIPATVRYARRRSGERHERSIPRPPALPAPLADPPIAPQPTHTRLRRAVIVNEYQPGQGIAPHVDRNCFGPTVATLSLGDSWPMEFTRVRRYAAHEEQVKLVLNVGSILVLTGEARSTWMHGIAKRKTDGRASNRRARRRRVSVTFRTMDVVGSEVVGAVMLDLSTT